MNASGIILMSDLREMKVRKERELEYYREQLRGMLHQMNLLQMEVNLTNRIIDMVEHEVPTAPVWARVAK